MRRFAVSHARRSRPRATAGSARRGRDRRRARDRAHVPSARRSAYSSREVARQPQRPVHGVVDDAGDVEPLAISEQVGEEIDTFSARLASSSASIAFAKNPSRASRSGRGKREARREVTRPLLPLRGRPFGEQREDRRGVVVAEHHPVGALGIVHPIDVSGVVEIRPSARRASGRARTSRAPRRAGTASCSAPRS